MKCQDGHIHVVEQFPLRLFHASTGDKVQGLSLNRAVVLGGTCNRRHNYLYVVLTRVHALAQLYLSKPLMTTHDMQYTGPDFL